MKLNFQVRLQTQFGPDSQQVSRAAMKIFDTDVSNVLVEGATGTVSREIHDYRVSAHEHHHAHVVHSAQTFRNSTTTTRLFLV